MNTQETPGLLEPVLDAGLQPVASGEARHGVSFSTPLGELRCLLPKGLRAELIHSPNISPLPSSNTWWVGIVNIRGELVPVIDLLTWSGLSLADADRKNLTTQIILLGQGESALAMTAHQQPQFVLAEPSKNYSGLEVPKLLPFIKATYIANQQHWIDLDFSAWLASLAGRKN